MVIIARRTCAWLLQATSAFSPTRPFGQTFWNLKPFFLPCLHSGQTLFQEEIHHIGSATQRRRARREREVVTTGRTTPIGPKKAFQRSLTSTLRQREGRAPPAVHHVTMLCQPGWGVHPGQGGQAQRGCPGMEAGVPAWRGVQPGWGWGSCTMTTTTQTWLHKAIPTSSRWA